VTLCGCSGVAVAARSSAHHDHALVGAPTVRRAFGREVPQITDTFGKFQNLYRVKAGGMKARDQISLTEYPHLKRRTFAPMKKQVTVYLDWIAVL
jgi:hypothetical protein